MKQKSAVSQELYQIMMDKGYSEPRHSNRAVLREKRFAPLAAGNLEGQRAALLRVKKKLVGGFTYGGKTYAQI